MGGRKWARMRPDGDVVDGRCCLAATGETRLRASEAAQKEARSRAPNDGGAKTPPPYIAQEVARGGVCLIGGVPCVMAQDQKTTLFHGCGVEGAEVRWPRAFGQCAVELFVHKHDCRSTVAESGVQVSTGRRYRFGTGWLYSVAGRNSVGAGPRPEFFAPLLDDREIGHKGKRPRRAGPNAEHPKLQDPTCAIRP